MERFFEYVTMVDWWGLLERLLPDGGSRAELGEPTKLLISGTRHNYLGSNAEFYYRKLSP
mgnify:CR=1